MKSPPLAWSPGAIRWEDDDGTEHALIESSSASLQLSRSRVERPPSWLEKLTRRLPSPAHELLASIRVSGGRLNLRARVREPSRLEALPLVDSQGTLINEAALEDILRTALLLGARVAHAAPRGERVAAYEEDEEEAEEREHEDALDFRDGLALTEHPSGEGLCFVDTTGEVSIPGPFEAALPFSYGRAAIRLNGLWGFINRKGEVTVDLKYDEVQPYEQRGEELVAKVRSFKVWQTIDLDGETSFRLPWWGWVALAVVVIVVAIVGHRFYYEHLCEERADVDACQTYDFSLEGVDWNHQSIHNADLSGADLSGANLSSARLKEIDLRGATLREVTLRAATLRKVTLSDSTFEAANLAGADLRSADFSGVVLTRATLDWAHLSAARFDDADLGAATLRVANLSGASLRRARLWRADFGEANMKGADLREANLKEATLREANLSGADLSGADLSGADLGGATLTGATYDEDTRWPEGFDPSRRDMKRSP